MGYEVVFVPSEEKMKQYKKVIGSCFSVNDLLLDLRAYCLQDHSKDTSFTVLLHLKTQLAVINKRVRDEEYQSAYDRWKSDKDHELWYCGWEFSHDSNTSYDDLLSYTLEHLFTLAFVISTPDYFKNEDNFYRKENAIQDYLTDFSDSCSTLVIHEIINDLDEFKKKYDEDDQVSEDPPKEVE